MKEPMISILRKRQESGENLSSQVWDEGGQIGAEETSFFSRNEWRRGQDTARVGSQ
jgi:hypothetical protein